jgi:hypothetical protein
MLRTNPFIVFSVESDDSAGQRELSTSLIDASVAVTKAGLICVIFSGNFLYVTTFEIRTILDKLATGRWILKLEVSLSDCEERSCDKSDRGAHFHERMCGE